MLNNNVRFDPTSLDPDMCEMCWKSLYTIHVGQIDIELSRITQANLHTNEDIL